MAHCSKGIVLPERLRCAILCNALTNDSSDISTTCLSDRSWKTTTLDSAGASPAVAPPAKSCEPPSPAASDGCGSESMATSREVSGKGRLDISRSMSAVRDRYKDSFLYRFACSSCSRREYDENMSNLVFVSALVLSMPFGVLGMLGGDFWDGLEVYVGACLADRQAEEQDGYLFYVQASLVGTLYAQLTCALTAFVIAASYFVLRPSEPNYRRWLWKGRLGFLVVFALAGYSVLGVSLAASKIVKYFTGNQTLACTTLRDDFSYNYLQQQTTTVRLAASVSATNWACLSLFLLCLVLFV